ncbi:hypothetical protein TNCT_31991 [Trichonephila clavata]|uniref:Uncharacterized protein n=1 Tax=Trichonephila clavata TaxID=2740835 RepID=A0A8X6LDT1_TRICU|nr:hypothetical protein TNCT_31991 [Trichonephila clavata]
MKIILNLNGNCDEKQGHFQIETERFVILCWSDLSHAPARRLEDRFQLISQTLTFRMLGPKNNAWNSLNLLLSKTSDQTGTYIFHLHLNFLLLKAGA